MSNGATGDKRAVSSVLFVCNMNAIRSPMAERLLKSLHGDRIYCDSAGVATGELDGFALAVMEEKGLDMQGHRPKTLEDLEDVYFDLIITLTDQAHGYTLDFVKGDPVEVLNWPTMDPSSIIGGREEILAGYRKIRDSLDKQIREKFES